MAANSAPDICFTYNDGVMYNYVKNGGLTDLGEVLDKYGSNFESKGTVPFDSFYNK